MPTERQSPDGLMLEDGFPIKITFEADPDIAIWEKVVTPSGADGGDPIDITTQHNLKVRTKAARSLYTVTDGKMTVAYDPAVITSILALINKPTLITEWYPDGSAIDNWGYLKSFVKSAHQEGAHPEAECEIIYTNRNADKEETEPVYHAPSSSSGV